MKIEKLKYSCAGFSVYQETTTEQSKLLFLNSRDYKPPSHYLPTFSSQHWDGISSLKHKNLHKGYIMQQCAGAYNMQVQEGDSWSYNTLNYIKFK